METFLWKILFFYFMVFILWNRNYKTICYMNFASYQMNHNKVDRKSHTTQQLTLFHFSIL